MTEITKDVFEPDMQLAQVFTGAASEAQKLNLALFLATGAIRDRANLSLVSQELPDQLDLLGVSPEMILDNLSANDGNFGLDKPDVSYCRKDYRGLHVKLDAKELNLLLKSDIPDDKMRAKLIKLLFVDRFYASKIFDLLNKDPFKNVKRNSFDALEEDEDPKNLYFAGSTKEAVSRNKKKKGLEGGKDLNGELKVLYEEKPEKPAPDNLRSVGSSFEEVQKNKVTHNRDLGSKNGELERIFPITKLQLNRKKQDRQQDLFRLLIEVARKPETLEWIIDPKADLKLTEEQRDFLEETKEEFKSEFPVAENFEEALRAFMRVYLGIQNDVSLNRRRLAGKFNLKNS